MSEAEQSREPQRAAGQVSGTEPREDSQESGKQPEAASGKSSDAPSAARIPPGSDGGSGASPTAARAGVPHQSTGSAAGRGPAKASAPKADALEADAPEAEGAAESEPGRSAGTGGKKAEKKPEREKPAQAGPGRAGTSPSAAVQAAGTPDSTRPESGRPGKPDAGKSDVAKSDVAKSEAGRSDAGRSDAGSAGAGKGGAGAAGSGKAEPARGGTGGGRSAASASAAGRGATGADGQLLAGRYRLGGVLGRGGMGTVWRAVDETLGRTVAVKELRFPNSIDEDEKRRLITRTLREAKAIARIRNNSAVTVYDVVDEDDRPWIVMELVEGKSLAEVIREDGTLTPRRAAEVGLAILDVLRSAHRQGILHRDVKPSNVLIAEDGRVVLTDFGIAQVEGDPSITSTGMLVGAPSYISPERARGHRPGPAADLWSLGGLLYASVEGAPPYDKGSAIATLTAVMTEPLDPPKNAGPLEEVIYGLLAKDPEQRLDDAGARKLLTAVVHAPEAPEQPAGPEAESDATRVIAMPPPPAPHRGPAARPPAQPAGKDPAADRLRGALRSVRNAAAAAAEPKPRPQEPAGRPAPVPAPITDVVSRRTLVIIAVVVVLAVLSVVLLLTLGGGEEGGKGAQGDRTASAGAASGGADGGAAAAGKDAAKGGNAKDTDSGGGPGGQDGGAAEGAKDGARGDNGDEPDGEQGDDGGKNGDKPGGAALPEGYKTVPNDQFHFSVAMPENFRQTGIAGRNSGAIFSESGGFPRLQIDFTSSPGDDAAWAWQQAVAGVRASSSGYRHLGIDKVAYNGYPTVADWQFERNQGGERVRVLNRGFKVDARRGYSIMISCKASEWQDEECTTLRETAFATFSPKD
ncbi:serine/threonine-protein kinase [Streptomyces sp. PR69]|uniref:serine/threonine-protein kinase n=1 Tax=Streptomyces sp. PR69 TaxID=2984950 RepID=UPI002263EE40|nr:serine/threonine protein kinase [Streptomyces sp. PR69]